MKITCGVVVTFVKNLEVTKCENQSVRSITGFKVPTKPRASLLSAWVAKGSWDQRGKDSTMQGLRKYWLQSHLDISDAKFRGKLTYTSPPTSENQGVGILKGRSSAQKVRKQSPERDPA